MKLLEILSAWEGFMCGKEKKIVGNNRMKFKTAKATRQSSHLPPSHPKAGLTIQQTSMLLHNSEIDRPSGHHLSEFTFEHHAEQV